jgi:hypothetical protein
MIAALDGSRTVLERAGEYLRADIADVVEDAIKRVAMVRRVIWLVDRALSQLRKATR